MEVRTGWVGTLLYLAAVPARLHRIEQSLSLSLSPLALRSPGPPGSSEESLCLAWHIAALPAGLGSPAGTCPALHHLFGAAHDVSGASPPAARHGTGKFGVGGCRCADGCAATCAGLGVITWLNSSALRFCGGACSAEYDSSL